MNRLLSINNYHYYRGGAEFVYLEHNRLLEAQGWEVMHYSMQHPENLASPWSDYFIEELEFGHEQGVFDKARKGLKSIYSSEARRNLRKLLASSKPTHAHAHNIYHHLTPSILLELKKHEIPTVITLHDLKIACPAYKMLNSNGVCEACKGGKLFNVVRNRCLKDSVAVSALAWMEARLHRLLKSYENNVDRFVVPSRFFIDKFVEWGWDASRFQHVPNFIDLDGYTPRYEPGRRFVYFGRLSHEKGIQTFMKALHESGASGTVVGTGPMEAEIHEFARTLSVDVDFLGYQTGDALKAAIADARAVVIPSEWYENAPISVLEAFALGKPVIGADIGGIPEMITPQETGAIFPSGSVTKLAGELERFAGLTDAQIGDMGRNARLTVEEKYSASRYVNTMLSLYAAL